MSYFEFSDGVRVMLSVEEQNFLNSFKQSIKLVDVKQSHLKTALTLVNKSVLYRKKRNGDLYYYKEKEASSI
jgi:phage antirepressor YoqD-like protein